MKERKYWLLVLSREKTKKQVTVKLLASDDVSAEGEELQVISLSKSKKLLQRIRQKEGDKRLITNWGSRGLINPENPFGVCLGSKDMERIIAQATRNNPQNETLWD